MHTFPQYFLHRLKHLSVQDFCKRKHIHSIWSTQGPPIFRICQDILSAFGKFALQKKDVNQTSPVNNRVNTGSLHQTHSPEEKQWFEKQHSDTYYAVTKTAQNTHCINIDSHNSNEQQQQQWKLHLGLQCWRISWFSVSAEMFLSIELDTNECCFIPFLNQGLRQTPVFC